MHREDTDRTRRLAREQGRWVLPHWLERQGDPDSAAWEPDPGAGPLRNVAERDVVPVGTVGAPHVATVDPRGLVTPVAGGWSLDWWVGADDRWHLPSREVAVRQSVLDGSPVVETAMRVPGGDVAERVWAFSDAGAGPVLAVEVRNDGRVPVALALAVRPYGPQGVTRIESIDVDASGVHVDGRRAMWLPRAPARVAASTWAVGDVAEVVLAGDAEAAAECGARCPDGLAQAAVVLPLSHGASVVVLLPMDPDIDTGAGPPTVVPPADAVVRGWAAHRARAARVVVPDAELSEALAAASSQVLLEGAGARLDRGSTRDIAAVAGALDHLGLHGEVDPVVAGLADGQRQGGRLGGDDTDPAATGAVLVVAGAHWSSGRDDALVDALAGPLAAGVHFRPGGGLLSRRTPPLDALSAGWQLAGALAVAPALDAVGQDDAAVAVRRSLGDLETTVTGEMSRLDPVEALDLVWLGAVPAGSERADAIVDAVRTRRLHELGVHIPGQGLSPERTARLATLELRRGEPIALDRLRWLVEVGGPTRVWPELISPRTGSGCAGAGWSPSAAAAIVDLVLELLVSVGDPTSSEIALLPVVPTGWLGAGVEAHGVSTALGVVSFAVRWHGERPALLWEVEPHAGVEGVRLTVPGLDPAWSTTDLRGEALLAAPQVAASPVAPDAPGSDDSFA